MKKIFATLLLALTTMAASAQDNPNRLIIQPKQGNPSGYLVERLDSVYFTKINGRVAADINLQGLYHRYHGRYAPPYRHQDSGMPGLPHCVCAGFYGQCPHLRRRRGPVL